MNPLIKRTRTRLKCLDILTGRGCGGRGGAVCQLDGPPHRRLPEHDRRVGETRVHHAPRWQHGDREQGGGGAEGVAQVEIPGYERQSDVGFTQPTYD